MSLLKRENQALDINYPPIPSSNGHPYINFAGGVAQIAITPRGSDWYWTVTAIMMVATFAFMGLATTKPRQERIFHYITALITMVASIAYFSMASNIGWAPISVEFVRDINGLQGGLTREIFYARYIDWVITTPLLLTDLLLTAGLPWPTIMFTIIIDEVMIVTGLIGALVRSSYKWGYYTFGCFALFYIAFVLLWEGPKHAKHLGDDVYKAFFLTGTWTIFLWFLYPIAWGVSEGGNVIHPDGEAVFYGILDILAKPVFGALLLWGHRNIDPARLGLHIRDYADAPAVKGSTKSHTEGSNGVTNGATNGTHTTTTATTSTAPNVATTTTHPETV